MPLANQHKVKTWRPNDGKEVERTAGACACGRTVVCRGFTNACACGRDYNMSGQALRPRSEWGEETGESVHEILAVDSDPIETEWDGDDFMDPERDDDDGLFVGGWSLDEAMED